VAVDRQAAGQKVHVRRMQENIKQADALEAECVAMSAGLQDKLNAFGGSDRTTSVTGRSNF